MKLIPSFPTSGAPLVPAKHLWHRWKHGDATWDLVVAKAGKEPVSGTDLRSFSSSAPTNCSPFLFLIIYKACELALCGMLPRKKAQTQGVADGLSSPVPVTLDLLNMPCSMDSVGCTSTRVPNVFLQVSSPQHIFSLLM